MADLPPCAILDFMQSPLQTPTPASDPKSVKVNLTTGTGVDIEWKDGHLSHYSFAYLRNACPCAMCEDERARAGLLPGQPPRLAPGALPMFKPAAKPVSAEAVGKYAIKFNWNDNHDLGLYSWKFLREICPCEECKNSNVATGSP
ncbi:MAG: gamma-butyrobetaine hydroxylase-like domain-containing protein [Candidatus Sulfotelmatobacter sp.]